MNPLEGRKILLVGGAGFIGHHLALAFKEAGARVEVVDSLQVNNLLVFAASADNIPNRDLYLQLINTRLQLLQQNGIPVHVQDARDYGAVSKLIYQINPDVIIHLAAIAHANRANKDPYSTFDHNLRTLENTLDSARSCDCRQFIYFSSSMIYGNFTTGTVTEEDPCYPIGIYGALKLSGEHLVVAYNQVFGLPYTIVRPSALYGERCVSRRVGQVFIENAAQGLDITIGGDGSDRLDFTYVGDLVQGVMKLVSHDSAINQTFNITYGESRTINEMAEILKSHFPEVKIHHKERDRLQPSRGTLSVDKARQLVGYEPQYPLEKGFVQYIQWYEGLLGEGVRKAAQS
jgi:nucleoside-diphosphate-sugar epimerase